MKVLPAARIYDMFMCQKHSNMRRKKVHTEIKEARAQRLHPDIVQFLNEIICLLHSEHPSLRTW